MSIRLQLSKPLAAPADGARVWARQATLISLHAGQTWSVNTEAGTRVHCLSGALWLTQESDARDIIVRAGQSLVVTRAGLLVAQAVGCSNAQLAFDATITPLTVPNESKSK